MVGDSEKMAEVEQFVLETINVPTDQPTLQAAIDAIGAVPVHPGTRFVVNIESGYQPASGISVQDGHFGNVRIASDDAVVTVGSSFTGSFIRASRATAPTLACLVDMNGLGQLGYELAIFSEGVTLPGCGCINSGGHGFEARSSRADINGADFSGAADTCIRVQQGSHVRASAVNADNAGFRGVYVSRGSMLQFMDGTARMCGVDSTSASAGGVISRRSYVNAEAVDCSGSRTGIYALNASIVAAAASNVSGCVSDGIRSSASWVDAVGSNASGAGVRGYRSQNGSTIIAINGDASKGGINIGVDNGSTVVAANCRTQNGLPAPQDTDVLCFNVPNGRGVIYDGAAQSYGFEVASSSDAGSQILLRRLGSAAPGGMRFHFTPGFARLTLDQGAGSHAFVVQMGGRPSLAVHESNVSSGISSVNDDDTKSLGSASIRWSQLYAASGTISTSDARLKTEVSPMSVQEIAAARALAKEIGTYRFLASLKEKGEGARIHVGVTTQRVIEIMADHRLDPMAYGFVCLDEWGALDIKHAAEQHASDLSGDAAEASAKDSWVEHCPAGSVYSLRPDQLALFIIRGQQAAYDDLDARMAALEAR